MHPIVSGGVAVSADGIDTTDIVWALVPLEKEMCARCKMDPCLLEDDEELVYSMPTCSSPCRWWHGVQKASLLH